MFPSFGRVVCQRFRGHALTSKTSAEVFEDLKNLRGGFWVFGALGFFGVFARFGRGFGKGFWCFLQGNVMVWEAYSSKPLRFLSKTPKTFPKTPKTLPNLAKTTKTPKTPKT